MFSAAAKLCIRSLGGTEPVSAIIYAMAAASTLGSAASCALLPAHFVVPASARQWGLLLGAGVLGCGVQVGAELWGRLAGRQSWAARGGTSMCRGAAVTPLPSPAHSPQVLATTALKLSKAAPVVMMSYLSGSLRCAVPRCVACWHAPLAAPAALPQPLACSPDAAWFVPLCPAPAVVWGMLLDLALGDRPGLLDLLGAALVCAASFVVVGLERRDGSASGGQSSVKAKDSSRTLGLGGDAHQWQRLAGEDEDGAANGAASGQQRQQPPSARQLELAEGGSAHIAAVRWGSAAEAELEGGAAKQASGAA